MLGESLQVLNPLLEAQINPHWFFNSCFSDEHEEANMLAGTSIREKVTPCPENRPAADKFQKGKRPLVDRTISPKAKFFVYFRSELPGDRSPKQAQSWRWQSRNDDSPYLDLDAGL
jgi:hypothetical protein